MPGRLHEFLSGSGRDARGRTVADVLAMGPAGLEASHDYIQWLFPLPTASMAQPSSPVLDAAQIAAIRADEAALSHLRAGAALMRRFYETQDHWLTGYDHNHLRITRIVSSLRLLAGEDDARAFLAAVEARCRAAGDPVNPRSRRYWADALAG
ncbi:opioid growth factor receptor-related protein [Alsobacter sp. SYSU BS001988]